MAHPTRTMQLQAIVATLDREWNTAHLEGHDYQDWLTTRLTKSFTITAGGIGNDTSYRWEGVVLGTTEQQQVRLMLDRLYDTGDMGTPPVIIPDDSDGHIAPEDLIV